MNNEPDRCYIAFDVGGHYIKSAVLGNDDRIMADTYAVFPANSTKSKAEIIDHLVSLIALQAKKLTDISMRVAGIGYAFPGPFDYASGVSHIRGIDKYDDLYGINIHQEIMEAVSRNTELSGILADDFRIVFENDARLFALGELHAGKAARYTRSVCLTIGTGAGSAFLEGGKLILDRHDVPPSGWIFNEPYGTTVVDDYVSKRGIMRMAADMGLRDIGRDVDYLAGLASCGDKQAIELFQAFGKTVGDALNPFINRFAPEALIIGGQIAKSLKLFADGIRSALDDKSIAIETAEETSLSAFIGVARLLGSSL